MQSDQFRLHAEIEERHWWFLGRRRIIRAVIHRLSSPSPSATIVDLGCGTGGNIASLAQEYSCIGFDISEEAILLAKRRFPDVRFVCGSDIEPGKAENGVRIFLLMDVLEHVFDDSTFLSDLVDKLRPGDYLLLTVPANTSLWSEHDVSFGHYRRYDLKRLEGVWSGLPLKVQLISYYNARLYPLVKVMRMISRLRGRAWGDAGTDLKMPMWPLNHLLEQIFAGEAEVLVDLLEGRRDRGYAFGVSLIALLRRETK